MSVQSYMYAYIGRVIVGGATGYMWLLGRRLYFKTSWRPRDTVYLGNLENPLGIALRLKRLIPRPVDVRKAVRAVVKALVMAGYLAERCRDSPFWKYRRWEVKAAVDQAASMLVHVWPWTARLFSPRRGRPP